MTEDSCPKVSSSESDSSSTKQRKKRKWDQPDESLISAGVAVPGIFPLTNLESLACITLPVVQVAHVPLKQHAAAIVQNLVQSRIQDELIAREIVINDADSAIRYKLTKRQTQEEIQKCTGAVVITRGKYRSPNAPSDGERPLYLHISAAANLETTAERIKAVDHAAAMVEEMLKQRSVSNGVKGDQLLNSCVVLGFEADPSLNIASRIRGPNDQYVNHIMNETGATVLLRGCGSGNSENEQTEEAQQPLHLFLSSNDPKSLEHAKLLAENLMDTISVECGISRVLHCKLYGAVPPPSQLQPGLLTPGNASEANNIDASSSTPLAGVSNVVSQGTIYQSVGVSNPGLPAACYPRASLASGTSYNGYGGIYPQTTPLQQVALALKQSTSLVTATVAPTTTAVVTESATEALPSVNNRRPQKRKFQELSAAAKGPANPNQKNLQGSEFPMPRELTSHVGARDISVLQAPKKSVLQPFKGMPPSLPRSIAQRSPPPKFNSTSMLHGDNTVLHISKPESVPDTLIKLMDYGEDDDDDNHDDDLNETVGKEPFKSHSSTASLPKPFWAI